MAFSPHHARVRKHTPLPGNCRGRIRAQPLFQDLHGPVEPRYVQALLNAVPAMASHSKILIAENVVPAIHATRGMALQDLNMMGFGGLEWTERQLRELLISAGLKLGKVWRSDDTKHAMIEARLQ